ncbi:gag pol polyprotein-like protein, partial [Dinothrombium tinctorium]
LVNFYRRFIPNAAHHLCPLNSLLKNRKEKHSALEWNVEADNSFKKIKEELANATLLNHPIPNTQLAIFVDASELSIGGSLVQKDGKDWKPISFFSKQLKPQQKKVV